MVYDLPPGPYQLPVCPFLRGEDPHLLEHIVFKQPGQLVTVLFICFDPAPTFSGDAGFCQIAEQIIAPFVRGFQPEIILVSAGFDSHWSDPLTQLGLSTKGFFDLSRHLVELADEYCKGKIVFALEGGYDAKNVAKGVEAVFLATAGQKRLGEEADLSPYPEPYLKERIQSVRELHKFF